MDGTINCTPSSLKPALPVHVESRGVQTCRSTGGVHKEVDWGEEEV